MNCISDDPWGYSNRQCLLLELPRGLSAVNAIGTQMRDPHKLRTDTVAVDSIDGDAVAKSERKERSP